MRENACPSSWLAARSLVETEIVMSDTPEHEAHRRPHAPPMAGPFMEFDLPAEIHRLHAETTWSTGHNARTLIKYDDFRVVLTALQASACPHTQDRGANLDPRAVRPRPGEGLRADVQSSPRRFARTRSGRAP